MIEIKSAAPDEAKRLCEQYAPSADAAIVMTERGERVGFLCMKQTGDTVDLYCGQASDSVLLDALLRATLNAVRAEGGKAVRIICPQLMAHARKRQYIGDSADDTLEIADFFAKSVCKA